MSTWQWLSETTPTPETVERPARLLTARVLPRRATCEEAAEALRALSRARADWQPIATAPCDGSPVLIGWRDDAGAWTERRAWWIAADPSETGWTDGAVQSWGYEEVQVYQPTHWMPLPAAPGSRKHGRR